MLQQINTLVLSCAKTIKKTNNAIIFWVPQNQFQCTTEVKWLATDAYICGDWFWKLHNSACNLRGIVSLWFLPHEFSLQHHYQFCKEFLPRQFLFNLLQCNPLQIKALWSLDDGFSVLTLFPVYFVWAFVRIIFATACSFWLTSTD